MTNTTELMPVTENLINSKMSTSKGVVVKINEEPYLTTYKCGETIDGLLNRLNQNFKVSPNDHRLYILSKQLEEEEKIAPLPDQNNISIKFFEDFDSSRHPWLSSLFNEMDTLILHLRPTIKSLMARKVVLEYIKKNLSKCLGARVFCIGSSMNNIFLPNETIEVTPFLCKGQEDKWFLRVNEGLCASAMANGGLDENVHIKSITFNCENASILVNINQLSVNVCHNELVSLYSGALLEDLNHNFGRKSLIKKSLLFIKSWCCYDSNQYSAAGKSLFPDLLSAKVLHILVLHIFCRYGTLISHPIVALSIFLYYYSNIEWNSVIINVESSLSAVDMNPLTDLDLFPNNSPLEGMENTNSDEIQQIKSLITNYRLRYQSTIWASTRAKEEDTSELSNDPIPRDSSISERESEDRFSGDPITFKNFIKGAPAWGISSACPSLTNEFQLPQGLLESEIFETYDGKKKGIIDAPSFNVSHMNISDSIRPSVNLTAHLTLADVEHITSILSSGYDRLSTVFKRCAKNSSEQLDEIDLGMNMKMDLTSYFISETIGMSRDVANIQKVSAYSPDDAANIDELKSSKFFCESEGPESVMRHAELIMGSKITADAVAHLIAHIVEQAGPHPIGEIGKLLQEATGNPNLSRVLKSQFRGLKKLIEGYPHMLRLGGDHSFNPHVYLADKSSSSNNSEVCVDSSLEAMTDRDSDDPISPPGSLSQTTKKQPITQQQSPLNYQTNNRVLNIPQDNYQYYASVSNSQINNNNNNSNNNVNVNINVNGTMNNNIINNNNNNSNNSTNNNTKGQQILSQHYQSQLQQYRPSSSISPWQIQDNNRNALYNTNTTTNSNNTNSNININANSNNNNSNNNNNNISSPSSSNTNISGVTHQSRNGIGVSRLHVDAGEYDPHRGTIEYYTQNNIKSRSDNYMGVEMNPVNRNSIQQIQQQQSLTQSSSMNGNTLAHQYASYRKSSQSQQQQQQSQQQLQQQQQQYDQYLYQSSGSGRSTILPSRSQNLNTYQTISRNQQMMRSPLNQGTNSRYDMISENSYLDITNRQNSINNSNRLNYNNSNSGSNINVNINNSNNNNLQTWERNSLGQYDTDLSYQSNSYNSNNNINNNNSGSSSSSNLQTIRQNPSNIVDARSSLGLSYDIDYSRSSRSMPLSNGRLQQTDNLDLSLEFETADRQSFLLPSDYDLASQSYSISDYDILKDAVYANTNQSISMNLIGHEYEENNTNILMGNRQYPDGDIISSSNTSRLDGRESFYGDSKMLPYFLRESER